MMDYPLLHQALEAAAPTPRGARMRASIPSWLDQIAPELLLVQQGRAVVPDRGHFRHPSGCAREYITPRFTAAEIEKDAAPLTKPSLPSWKPNSPRAIPETEGQRLEPSFTGRKISRDLLPCASPAIHTDDLAVNEGSRGRG